MAAEAIDVIMMVSKAVRTIYQQIQEVKHLKVFAISLEERVKVIQEIIRLPDFENHSYSKKYPGIKKALNATEETLTEVNKYLVILSQQDKKIEAKIFLFVGEYVKEYERLLQCLNHDIEALHAAVGITSSQVDKITKKSDVIKEVLTKVNEDLQNSLKQAAANGEKLSNLENYIETLNEGIHELNAGYKIDKEFYSRCSISNVTHGLALRAIGKDDKVSNDDLKLMQNIPNNMSANIDCAISNKLGGTAAVVSVENSMEFKAVLDFIERRAFFIGGQQRQGSLDSTVSQAADSPPAQPREEGGEGISCEKISENKFKVIINYPRLRLMPIQIQGLQALLKGRDGEQAYNYINSIKDKKGNITELLFEDKESADTLIAELNKMIAAGKSVSVPAAPPTPAPRHKTDLNQYCAISGQNGTSIVVIKNDAHYSEQQSRTFLYEVGYYLCNLGLITKTKQHLENAEDETILFYYYRISTLLEFLGYKLPSFDSLEESLINHIGFSIRNRYPNYQVYFDLGHLIGRLDIAEAYSKFSADKKWLAQLFLVQEEEEIKSKLSLCIGKERACKLLDEFLEAEDAKNLYDKIGEVLTTIDISELSGINAAQSLPIPSQSNWSPSFLRSSKSESSGSGLEKKEERKPPSPPL